MHSEAIICTCTETVLAHLNTMYLIVLWPPVPILCVYIYCTYSACTCTYQGHMVCLCLFTYQGVKRHHTPVRQSLWHQTVLRKTPPIHRKYSISGRAAESLHLHLKWVEHTKIKCDLSWTAVNLTTWKKLKIKIDLCNRRKPGETLKF
jgi:hypothetical protein